MTAFSTKYYVIYRNESGQIKCRVVSEWGDFEGDFPANLDSEDYKLPHIVHHSPDGFEVGYSGSGPSELARCIVADYLGMPQLDTVRGINLKLAIRDEFISEYRESDLPTLLTERDIRAVLERVDSALEATS